MPPNKDRPSVSIDLARILIRFASDKGLDGLKIWRTAGLARRLFQSGEARISARRFDALWRAVEDETSDDYFGLKLGQAMKDYVGGHLLYAMLMNSPTVEAALVKFCRYHCIMSDVVQPRLVDASKTPRILLETPHPEPSLGLGHEAFIFSLFASIIENLTGSRKNIREIRFAHPQPEKMDAYRSVFHCPILFRQAESAMLLTKGAIDHPVFLASPDLLSGLETIALKRMEQLATENTARRGAASALGRMLLNGDKPAVGEVAKALAMSTRRLQQILKSEQTGYRELLDQVRKETAIRLLENRAATISEITFILGFSEQSSFTHAFRKWTGKTPGQYRKHSQEDAGHPF